MTRRFQRSLSREWQGGGPKKKQSMPRGGNGGLSRARRRERRDGSGIIPRQPGPLRLGHGEKYKRKEREKNGYSKLL